jgi:hypothetical protein
MSTLERDGTTEPAVVECMWSQVTHLPMGSLNHNDLIMSKSYAGSESF